jgi:hypothetical protein
MALLVLMTGIVAAGQAPTQATPVSANHLETTMIAHADEGNFGMAILSILLGGGMFFLFRPIRRVPVEVHS